MLGNSAFSKEEQERLLKAPNILADFFKRAGDVGFTVAAEQIRATYWEIETHATRLRRMAKGWQSENFEMSMTAAKTLNDAADELDKLTKFSVRRPISELRQEAFGSHRDGSAGRWVVFWAPSGFDNGTEWRCAVGRMDLLARPNRFRRHDGSPFTDDGAPPTHFSELPHDEA